jgi:transposase
MKRMESNNSVDVKSSIIAASIESIYDEKGVYKSSDYKFEQLKEFVEGLTEEKFRVLEKYVDNFPSFAVELKEKCTKCGFEHNVRYKDFYDFFF